MSSSPSSQTQHSIQASKAAPGSGLPVTLDTSIIASNTKPLCAPLSASSIVDIHQHCSLGFHVSILATLDSGITCAFTERYEDCNIPVNGVNACSLADVGRSGGPRLPAHEIALDIKGALTATEVRLLRRIRTLIPELVAAEITPAGKNTPSEIKLTVARDALISSKQLSLCHRICSTVGKRVRFCTSEMPFAVNPAVLSAADRALLRELGKVAWREPSATPAKKTTPAKKGGPPTSAEANKFVQSGIVDVEARFITLIDEGPERGNSHITKVSATGDEFDFSLKKHKTAGAAWLDTARSLLLGEVSRYESVRISSSVNSLTINVLVTGEPTSERASHFPRFQPGTSSQSLPYDVQIHWVASKSCKVRDAFEIVPTDWQFAQLITNEEVPGKALLVCNRGPGHAPALPVHQELETVTGVQVFDDSNRFHALDPSDRYIKYLVAQLPSGVGLQSIESCQITGELRLTTARPVPSTVIKSISKKLRRQVHQKQPTASVPVEFTPVVNLIANAPAIRRNPSRSMTDPLREVTVLGGNRIGGSCVALGRDGWIRVDQGASQDEPAQTVQLEGTTWGSPDFVVFSHGHFDHTGNMLPLWQELERLGSTGCTAQFLMTEPVALLSWLMFKEQLKRRGPDFHLRDVEKLFSRVRLTPFDYPNQLAHDVSLRMLQAGHHIGSTMNLFEHMGQRGRRRVLYSGDLKSDSDFGTRLYPAASIPTDLDALIIEATNGMAPAVSREAVEEELVQSVLSCVTKGGTAILPVLASGRAQEVLTILLRSIEEFSDHSIPIYVDGTSIHDNNSLFSYVAKAYPQLIRIHERTQQGWQAVYDKKFKSVANSQKQRLLNDPTPKVIVASGGMGRGPALDYIKAFGNSPKNSIIFTCHQVQRSYGSWLLSEYQSSDDGMAQVKIYRLTGHNFGEETLRFVQRSLRRGGVVILTHASLENSQALQAALQEQGHAGRVIIAEPGEPIELW